MASNEDSDLIDLRNDSCVPRVTVGNLISEEQEHLLDVCLPKLEQTLSLTRRQEQVSDSDDKSDILVTLGHDQVMPIRKRIDVVSSDTIKRIRDITRNLEPVIHRTYLDINEETQQDTVDHATASSYELTSSQRKNHEDETYETQEISNAFNFLAELDDNEDQVNTGFDHARNDNVDSISFVRSSIEENEKENMANYLSKSSKFVNGKKTDRKNEKKNNMNVIFNDIYLDNPTFESWPNSFREDSPVRRSISIDSESHARIMFKRSDRNNVAFERKSKRRSLQHSHRKSWTEGTSLNLNPTNGFPDIDRFSSFMTYSGAPSTSDIKRGTVSFFMRYDCLYSIFL